MSDNKLDKKTSLRKKKGSYSISVVAEMFGVHQQTIRLYEKEGLISPSRSVGNTRKFSEEDVNELEEVIYLTHKLGVNLAGVSIILKLKNKLKKMQEEVNSAFDKVKKGLDNDTLILKNSSQSHLQQLAKIKSKHIQNKDQENGPTVFEQDFLRSLMEMSQSELDDSEDEE